MDLNWVIKDPSTWCLGVSFELECLMDLSWDGGHHFFTGMDRASKESNKDSTLDPPSSQFHL